MHSRSVRGHLRQCGSLRWPLSAREEVMFLRSRTSTILAVTLLVGMLVATAEAKDKVKVGFIGPLTGGVSVNGLGGRNSADLSVRLRNADAKAKYEYEL